MMIDWEPIFHPCGAHTHTISFSFLPAELMWDRTNISNDLFVYLSYVESRHPCGHNFLNTQQPSKRVSELDPTSSPCQKNDSSLLISRTSISSRLFASRVFVRMTRGIPYNRSCNRSLNTNTEANEPTSHDRS